MALRLNQNIINSFNTTPIINQEQAYIEQNNKKGNYSSAPKDKVSLFGTSALKPVGMKTILFDESDIAARQNDLALNLGFPTTILNDGSTLKAMVEAEYSTNKTSYINGIVIPSKKSYDNTGIDPIIKRSIGQVWNTKKERIETDLERFSIYLNSPQGKLFIFNQQGLQLTNPKTQTLDPFGISNTNRVYNPLSLPAAIAGWEIGYHPNRHGAFGIDPDYEAITKLKSQDIFNTNNIPAPMVGNRILQMLKYKSVGMMEPGMLNIPFSGPMGPNSLYGVGFTGIIVNPGLRSYSKPEQLQLTNNKNLVPNIKLSNTITDARTYSDTNPYYKTNTHIFALDVTVQTESKSKIIHILDAAQESNSYPGYLINYHLKKKDFINTDTYSSNNKGYTVNNTFEDAAAMPGENNQVKEVKVTSKQTGQSNKDGGSSIYNKITSVDDKWNPGGGNASNTSIYALGDNTYSTDPLGGGLPIYDPSITNEADAYNTLKGYKDLNDPNLISQNKSIRGAVLGGRKISDDGTDNGQNPIYVDTPAWSKVGKYYNKKLGNKYFSSMYGEEIMMPTYGKDDTVDALYKNDFNTDGTFKVSDDDRKFIVQPNDFIKLIIGGIQFRATISGLSYRFSPTFNDIQYLGRPDTVGMYQGLKREVSFAFVVSALSYDEMNAMYSKLNLLAGRVSPDIVGNRMVAPIYALTIGTLIDNEFGYLTDLTFDIDDDFTWDIDDYKKPMHVKVSCTFNIIGKQSPYKYNNYFNVDKTVFKVSQQPGVINPNNNPGTVNNSTSSPAGSSGNSTPVGVNSGGGNDTSGTGTGIGGVGTRIPDPNVTVPTPEFI